MTPHAILLCAALLPAADVPAGDANAADLAKMQGDWMVVSMTIDGTKLGNDEAQSIFRTVTGNGYRMFRFSKAVGRGTLKLDASKKPKTIDSTPAVPPNAKPVLGIYQFDGKTLKICNGRPGQPRPTEFGAKEGS